MSIKTSPNRYPGSQWPQTTPTYPPDPVKWTPRSPKSSPRDPTWRFVNEKTTPSTSQMSRWTHTSMKQQINESTTQRVKNQRIDESINRWSSETMNRWMNETIHQRIDESTKHWLLNKWMHESMKQRINDSRFEIGGGRRQGRSLRINSPNTFKMNRWEC